MEEHGLTKKMCVCLVHFFVHVFNGSFCFGPLMGSVRPAPSSYGCSLNNKWRIIPYQVPSGDNESVSNPDMWTLPSVWGNIASHSFLVFIRLANCDSELIAYCLLLPKYYLLSVLVRLTSEVCCIYFDTSLFLFF